MADDDRDGTSGLSVRRELEALVDAFPDVGFILDGNGTYREVLSSPESEELLYDDPEGLIGSDLHDVFPPEDADRVYAAVRESLDVGELRRVEYPLEVPAGVRHFEARIHPIETDDDTERVVFVARDVTERRRYARAIERERGYMQELLESTDDVFLVVDPDGSLVDWNCRLPEVTGHSEAALGSMTVDDLFPTTDAETLNSLNRAVLDTGRAKEELEIETGEGDHVPYEFVVTLFEDRDDAHLFAAIGRETTERKRRETELRARQEMLDGVIQSLDDVFFVLEPGGDVVRYNESAVEVTGYSHAQVEEMNALEFFHEDDFEAVAQAIYRGFADGYAQVEADLRTSDGESIPYEFVASAFERHDGQRVLTGIGRDISDRRERQQQVRVFGRVLRHDIRNKLDVVRGGAERLAESDAESAGRILAAADDLLRTSEKAHRITELLLGNHAVEPLSVADEIAAAADHCREEFPDATVRTDLDDASQVEAIPEIRGAFVELIENGIVHADACDPVVRLCVTTEDESVVVTVDDDGPGVPAHEREVITGDTEITPLTHGSGIGLWLVNWIVGRSGGDLTFDDGAVACVRLPRPGATGSGR